MKQTLLSLLAVIALGITATSCSNEMEEMKEETVQVTFQAELPKVLVTRAGGEEEGNESEGSENTTPSNPYADFKVICAVFEGTDQTGYTEVRNLRQYATEAEGGTLSYTPRLVKGRSYKIVFWASKPGSYNVSNTEGDLTSISRSEGSSLPESAFDAFTFSVPFSGVFDVATPIAAPLSRPFAKINIGVTETDLNGVINGFGQTPTTMVIRVDGASPSYNALTGEKTGGDVVTYTHSVLNGTLDEYKHLSECFVLADSNVSVTYTIEDQSGSTICTGTIADVPAQPNYNTNIVGGLMTGTVSYNITFDPAFEVDSDMDLDEEENESNE